MKIQLW